MHLVDLYRLEATGGAVLQYYRELTAQADASAHDSPAVRAKAQFELDWQTDPEALQRDIEGEAADAADAVATAMKNHHGAMKNHHAHPPPAAARARGPHQ
jgi:hypothetical protein